MKAAHEEIREHLESLGLKLFTDGTESEDLTTSNSSKLFGVSPEEVTYSQRKEAKRLMFSAMYSNNELVEIDPISYGLISVIPSIIYHVVEALENHLGPVKLALDSSQGVWVTIDKQDLLESLHELAEGSSVLNAFVKHEIFYLEVKQK